MQTVNSSIVIPLRIIGWFLSLPLLTGCNFSPAIPVIGAYYPDWLFCLIGGVILTLITRKVILHKYSGLAFIGIILYRPFCPLLHAVLAGIFLTYFETPLWKARRKKLRVTNFPR